MLDTLCFFFSFSPPNKIGDRFICRTLKQKLYDKALTIGLQGYAQLHEPQFLRLANWEGIKKVSRLINHRPISYTVYLVDALKQAEFLSK